MSRCVSKDCRGAGTVVVEGEWLCPSCATLLGQLATIIDQEENGGRVVYSLAAVKGVGKDVAHAIVNERKANGQFRSLADFAARVDVNKKMLSALAKAGAFDTLEPNRAMVVENVDALLSLRKRVKAGQESGTGSLSDVWGD